jgi:CBS domain containing-hemolysin-like protein
MRPRDQLLVVPADAAIADVIDQALARQIKLVVVTGPHGNVVGMADRADLLGALLPTI